MDVNRNVAVNECPVCGAQDGLYSVEYASAREPLFKVMRNLTKGTRMGLEQAEPRPLCETTLAFPIIYR
ncbi:hypothetical protein RB195_012250 [Necator americanus]|uniref:Uncharacterized protein n=1 Tax=Necator americanus TaxID=51031 RepID=A0ABR1D680_NECAM